MIFKIFTPVISNGVEDTGEIPYKRQTPYESPPRLRRVRNDKPAGKFWIAASLALLGVTFPLSPARADCANPNGKEADMIYNADYQMMQFCNGGQWIAMSGAGALIETNVVTGSACAAPQSFAMSDADTPLYCNDTTGQWTTIPVTGKVDKGGDTMTGPLILSGAPTENAQAATKEYVDTVAAAGSNDNGLYQMACGDHGSYYNTLYCLRMNTQTGSIICKTVSSPGGAWSNCPSPW